MSVGSCLHGGAGTNILALKYGALLLHKVLSPWRFTVGILLIQTWVGMGREERKKERNFGAYLIIFLLLSSLTLESFASHKYLDYANEREKVV